MDRRRLLTAGAVLAAGATTSACGGDAAAPDFRPGSLSAGDDWDDVRALFDLSPETIHMGAMLISSHPRPVREAIERHRRALDADPVLYLERNNRRMTEATRRAAADYLGMRAGDIALTDSATMGIGVAYNGLMLGPGDEILSTEQDYFVTHEAIRVAAERARGTVRLVPLHDEG